MFGENATAITILFIIFAAALGAFIRKRSRDKCLRDFEHNMVTLEETAGKTICGRLRVENTGLEFVYPQKQKDENGHNEASYILYKYEYPKIGLIIRFHDELTDENRKARDKELKKTYHPNWERRLGRKTMNVLRTVKDSIMEIVNLIKKTTPAGKMLTSKEYESRMQQDLMGTVGTSFEPLLERYIGHKVVLEMIKSDKIFEYCGVLKEYTAEFIEIMDVNYKTTEEQPTRTADLTVPRKLGVVRHLAE